MKLLHMEILNLCNFDINRLTLVTQCENFSNLINTQHICVLCITVYFRKFYTERYVFYVDPVLSYVHCTYDLEVLLISKKFIVLLVHLYLLGYCIFHTLECLQMY